MIFILLQSILIEKKIGESMVKKTMYQKIIQMKQQGFCKYEISVQLKLNYRTVSRYYDMTDESFKSYRNHLLIKTKVFDPFEQEILDLYSANDNRKLNIAAVYDYLEEKYKMLTGTEKTLSNYIQYLNISGKLEFNEKHRIYQQVPELPYGKQMQLDFGVHPFNTSQKMFILASVLSASRYKHAFLQQDILKTSHVCNYLIDAFTFYGGITEEVVIDQDSLLVASENHGDIIFTREFQSFIEEMGLKVYVCRKADPESKGKIENFIGYIKHNFLSVRNFTNIESANESLTKWLHRRANGKISQATRNIPADVIEEERKYLKPLCKSIFMKDRLFMRQTRSVDDKGYISYDACSYLVPFKYRNKSVEIYTSEKVLFIFDPITDQEITQYDISLIPGKRMVHRNFLRDKQTSCQALKEYVYAMFGIDEWKLFAAENFKQFTRYVRDQSCDAKKYFDQQNIDRSVLLSALTVCLENHTHSFSNLNDTYQKLYAIQHATTCHNPIKNNPLTNHSVILKKTDPIRVDIETPDISTYQHLIEQKIAEAAHDEII